MLNEGKSRQVLLSVLGVAILVVAVVGISYAAFTATVTDSGTNAITTGTITMSYSEPVASVSIENAMPVADATTTTYDAGQNFQFTISANAQAAMTIPYTVTFRPDANNDLAATDVMIGLKKDSAVVRDAGFQINSTTVDYQYGVLASTLEGNATNDLYRGTLSVAGDGTAASAVFNVYMWIAHTATVTPGASDSYKLFVDVSAARTPLAAS